MNKYFLYAASVLALASCSSDDFLGENSGNGQNAANSVINFGGETGKITRAANGTSVGASAAKLLGGKFYVLGTKGTLPDYNPTETIVFDNYQVNWKENSAGTTTDNTNDWEYVGVTPTGLNAGGNKITAQSIKYWDYSQPHYDFIAYSVGDNILATSGDAVEGTIVGSAIQTPKANAEEGKNYFSYSLKGKTIKDLQECYYTDVTPVEKDDYKKPVKFTFKNLTAKVRVAFYETIPGYTVSDIQFYDNANDPRAELTDKDEAYLYTTGGIQLSTNGTINVTYPKVGSKNASDPAFNKAFVSIVTGTDNTTTKLGLGTVNYNNGVLNDNAKEANMAGKVENNYFTAVLPAEGHALTLRLNYTLTSTDGSGEQIKVYGATAVIPASYTAWQPNHAYTYIFKISDNTNGATSTDTTTPDGLFPITFDAVVADVDNVDFSHESITTVATPSVTTYAFNSTTKKVIKAYGVGNEYPAAKTTDIYFSVSEDGNTMNDLDSKGQLYSVSDAGATEATVIDALQISASKNENTITGRNNIVLTKVKTDIVNEIPKEDGEPIKVGDNTTAKFTATETATTYAYVYLKKKGTPTTIYTAVTIGNDGTSIIAGDGEYFEDPSGKKAVTQGTTLTVGTTYYKKYTNNNNIYGVKVVKTYK